MSQEQCGHTRGDDTKCSGCGGTWKEIYAEARAEQRRSEFRKIGHLYVHDNPLSFIQDRIAALHPGPDPGDGRELICRLEIVHEESFPTIRLAVGWGKVTPRNWGPRVQVLPIIS